jgi:DNA-binding CsgD family transcriptional regulator
VKRIDYSPEKIQQRRERVVELTRQGYSAPAIAGFLGITKRSVVRIRAHMGVAQEPSGPPLSEAEKAQAALLLGDGCSYADVGRTLGRHPNSIRRHFPGMGWEREQCGQLAVLSRRANERLAEVWGTR